MTMWKEFQQNLSGSVGQNAATGKAKGESKR
jgi:hypothetical protein